MRVAEYTQYGPPEVVAIAERPEPVPGAGRVRVRVHAAPVGSSDAAGRSGTPWFARLAYGFRAPKQQVLGSEFAGVVDAVGPGVTRFAVGDRVFGATGVDAGAHADQVVVAETSALVRLPGEVSMTDAAAICDGAMTALPFLRDGAHVGPGARVLVNGASGSVGSAAVQLAKLAGAFVIGNASSQDKLDRARELGMDVGINHQTEDVAERVMEITDGRGADLVYEHVGGELFQKGLDSLGKDGRLVICGGHSGEVVPFDIIPFFRAQKSVIGSFIYTKDELETCFDLVAHRRIRPLIHTTFPLEQAAQAMELMERREQFGKILLIP